MDESLKADVMYWAAFYERRMRVGNKKIFHLEAWVVKVMSLYKVMYTPTSPWGIRSEGHLSSRCLTDDLRSAPFVALLL
jgi:hypothetical protein